MRVKIKSSGKKSMTEAGVKRFKLFYPSSVYPHKRHDFLLASIELLERYGIELIFTIDEEKLDPNSSGNIGPSNHIRFLGTLPMKWSSIS